MTFLIHFLGHSLVFCFAKACKKPNTTFLYHNEVETNEGFDISNEQLCSSGHLADWCVVVACATSRLLLSLISILMPSVMWTVVTLMINLLTISVNLSIGHIAQVTHQDGDSKYHEQCTHLSTMVFFLFVILKSDAKYFNQLVNIVRFHAKNHYLCRVYVQDSSSFVVSTYTHPFGM